MNDMHVKIAEGGRIVIPAEARQALGLRAGDEMVLQVRDGEIRLFTVREALRRAQALVHQSIPQRVSLADELIADRRREEADA
jgi:AbrB family looped-hinge helix DNA binding protein